jgi:GTPase
MTTLKSFQAEIEAISHEKHQLQIKEAREAHLAAELAKHHHKPKKDAAPAVVKEVPEEEHVEVPLEDVLLGEDADELRSRLATALLRGHGELLIPLGAHPPPSHLLGDEATVKGASVGQRLSSTELDAAIARIRAVCDLLKAELTELYRVNADAAYGCWLIRLTPRGAEEIMEVRVAVVGNVDAGKSTTLGVLTRGTLDDGRGKARVALFRHPHEIETGRTSSVGGEILGFSPTGEAVVPTGHLAEVEGHLAAAKREKLGWEEICKRAAKVISFIDLAGHER